MSEKAGWLLFWLGYPVLWLYLHNSKRTRLLVIVGEEVLLLKSWLGTGRWSLPGGGLHRGESVQKGALRELAEETGMYVDDEQLTPLSKTSAEQYGIRIFYTSFTVTLAVKPDLRRQRFEVSKIAWMPYSEALRGRLSTDTRAVLETWSKTKNLL